MSNFWILISVLAAAILGDVIGRIIDKYVVIIKKPIHLILGIFAGVLALVFLTAIPLFNTQSLRPEIIKKLQSSPYEKSYIDLISATPKNETVLQGGGDLVYSYTVKYYVPEFDWERLGFEPRLVVTAEEEQTIYGKESYTVLKSVPVQTGVETTTEIEGRFIAPNDRNEWKIEIHLTFEDEDQSKPRIEGLIIPITYKISRTDYKEAYIELVSAKPDPKANAHLLAGDEVEFEFTVKYFVSSFEHEQSGFNPKLTLRMVTGHDEFGGTSAPELLNLDAVVGEVTTFTLRHNLKIPENQSDLELWVSVIVDPKRTPLKQIIKANYQISEK